MKGKTMKLSVFYDHILQAANQTGRSVEELLSEVREAGIEAVEIHMTDLLEHEETYALLKQAGLLVSCVYEFYEMELKSETQKARLHIETAGKVGAKRILVVPGFLTEEDAKQLKDFVMDGERVTAFLNHNESARRMARGLSEIVTLGEAAGVTVTIEDFDDMKSPIASVNGMLWFLRQIPQLKVTFDTGNFITHGEDLLEAWESLQEYVVHVHCKDRSTIPVAVGEGYIPISSILNRLKQQNYDGYLAIEHFDAGNQAESMKKSASFLLGC